MSSSYLWYHSYQLINKDSPLKSYFRCFKVRRERTKAIFFHCETDTCKLRGTSCIKQVLRAQQLGFVTYRTSLASNLDLEIACTSLAFHYYTKIFYSSRSHRFLINNEKILQIFRSLSALINNTKILNSSRSLRALVKKKASTLNIPKPCVSLLKI